MVSPPSSTESLSSIDTYSFLPPVNRWVAVGSWVIVLALSGAIVASFSVSYRTTVKASAIIRPVGEPRLVQPTAAGTVESIRVKNNTVVQSGEIIARLDTSSLKAQSVQLSANLEQANSRLQQLEAQMIAADQQLVAESAQSQRATAAATADYDQILRVNQDQSITAQSDVQEAQVQLRLAVKEAESFRQLVESGAVSRLQLDEKQTALASAQARMTRLQAVLNPSQGEVQAARERIAQAQAAGVATIARLQQSQQQLMQQRLEIQEQLKNIEQEIAQVELALQNAVVRSPISGILHELSLRNPGQVVNPGDIIARVIPANLPIVIKAVVPTQQINKIEVGLPAQMQVSACPFSEFGTVAGRVKEISPDAVTLSSSNDSNAISSTQVGSFYNVIIETDILDLESKNQEKCALFSGMEGRATITSRKEPIITFLRRKAGFATNF